MTEKKAKPLRPFRVKMGIWDFHRQGGGRIDCGWTRRDIVVAAESRAAAIKLVLKRFSCQILPPATGDGVTKRVKDVRTGKYFLVRAGGRNYCIQSTSKGQAKNDARQALARTWDRDNPFPPPRPAWSVWQITATPQRTSEERREIGLPPIKLTPPPPPWECELCGFEDYSRPPENNHSPCVNCSRVPLSDGAKLDIATRQSASGSGVASATITAGSSRPVTPSLFDATPP